MVSTATSPIRTIRPAIVARAAASASAATPPDPASPSPPPMSQYHHNQEQHQQQQQQFLLPQTPKPGAATTGGGTMADLINRSVLLSPGQGHPSFFNGVMSPAPDASFMWDPACDVPLVATGDEPHSLLAELLAQSTLKLIEAHNNAQAAAHLGDGDGNVSMHFHRGEFGGQDETANESKTVLAELLAQSTKQLLMAHQQAAMLEQGYVAAADFEAYRTEVENQADEFDKFRAKVNDQAAAAAVEMVEAIAASASTVASLEGQVRDAAAARAATAASAAEDNASTAALVDDLEAALRTAKIVENRAAGETATLERALDAAQKDTVFLTAQLQDARAELGEAEARHAFETVKMDERLDAANAKHANITVRLAQLEREAGSECDSAAQLAVAKCAFDELTQKSQADAASSQAELAAATAARSAADGRVLELEIALASAQSAVVAQLDAARGALAALSEAHARESAEQHMELETAREALNAALSNKAGAVQRAAEMKQSLEVAVDAHFYLRSQLDQARGAAGVALGV
eukprot:gene27186-10802_t